MKKSLLIIAALFFVAKASFAQDSKAVRFGIHVSPAINWMSPDNDKKIQKNGAVAKAGLGLDLEFRLTDVATFQTGLEYVGAGFKAKYGTDTATYLYKDDEVLEGHIENTGVKEASDPAYFPSGGMINQLKTRKYNIGYLNIPLTFKLKTKDIGGFTYFGQLGGNAMVRINTRANDDVITYGMASPLGKSQTLTKVDIAKTMNLMNFAAQFGGGAEYNISGTTSLYASLHYIHSFTYATKQTSGYLFREKTDGGVTNTSQFPNGMRLRQIVLAIGILF